MNYAINLSPGAAPADLERALALASYPQIGTFFAQSESASFAPDMAEALAGSGNTVHSIGPTRLAAVPEVERVKAPAPGEKPDPAPAPAPEPTPDPAQSGDGTGQSGAQSGAQSGGVQSARGRALSEADGTEEISNWGAAAMNVAEAAGVPVAHAPVTVGIIDTGIDDMHPDLAGRPRSTGVGVTTTSTARTSPALSPPTTTGSASTASRRIRPSCRSRPPTPSSSSTPNT